jgi:hypothetical protein
VQQGFAIKPHTFTVTSKRFEGLAVVNVKTANVSEDLPASVFRPKMKEAGSFETSVNIPPDCTESHSRRPQYI